MSMDNLAEFEAVSLKPYYECNRHGVYYIALETDKDGNTTEKPPLKLSDPIRLIGHGTDSAGNHYRVIEWQDSITRQQHTTALPMAEIGQSWAKLQGMGIAILASKRKRELLADYLQTDGEQTHYTITGQAGWCAKNSAYVLPSGQVLSAKAVSGKNTPKVIYNGDKSQAAAYRVKGTLSEWQQHIGKYMEGNSRLCLAIGTALAAPLVSLLGLEAGGFHLFGDSRDGKSTAARAALSIWGSPSDLMLTWTGTGHGFANVANARNDGLLVLDEIGQAQPRHVSQTAYSVINGVSKIQGAKDGGNRDITRWNVLLLSTGEKSLDGFLQAGQADWNAGQAARLPSIPSNAGKGLGIFDTLHGHDKGSALSEAITSAANAYHGSVGVALIRLLLDNPNATKEASQLMADFMATLPDMDGQARTVATRFALVAAALELAARHGILGLGAGVCMPAIKQCFDAWLERTGAGKFEDRKILEQAIDFMQQNAYSHRFVTYPTGTGDRTPNDLAGYRKLNEKAPEHDSFYILPSVFVTEICKDFDKAKVCDVLHAANWLRKYITANEARYQHQLKGKGRLFLMLGALPPDELQE